MFAMPKRAPGTGGQGRIRTVVPRKEGQIYSLLALTTHPPVRSDSQSITCNIVTSMPALQSERKEGDPCGTSRRTFSFYLPAEHVWRLALQHGRTKTSRTGPTKTRRR